MRDEVFVRSNAPPTVVKCVGITTVKVHSKLSLLFPCPSLINKREHL